MPKSPVDKSESPAARFPTPEEIAQENRELFENCQEDWRAALEVLFEWTDYFSHVEDAVRILYKLCPASADLRQLSIGLSDLRNQVGAVNDVATRVASGDIKERHGPRTWAEAHGQ